MKADSVMAKSSSESTRETGGVLALFPSRREVSINDDVFDHIFCRFRGVFQTAHVGFYSGLRTVFVLPHFGGIGSVFVGRSRDLYISVRNKSRRPGYCMAGGMEKACISEMAGVLYEDKHRVFARVPMALNLPRCHHVGVLASFLAST